MNSENNQSSPQPEPAAMPQNVRPQANEIVKGLSDADDPLAFVRQNLQAMPQHQVVPEQVVKEEEVKREEETKELKTNFSDEPPIEEPKVEDSSEDSEETEPSDDDGESLLDEALKPKGPQDSIRNLRKKTNELQKVVQEKDSLTEELKGELEKYKAGELVPEKFQRMAERIQELEKYEKLHALKLSPDYKKKYVEPLNQAKKDILDFAKEYNLDEGIAAKAVNLKGKALNDFISNHFDQFGGIEFKQKVNQVQQLHQAAIDAEKEPKQALEAIMQDNEAASQARKAEAKSKIAKTSKAGWTSALKELRDDGRYPELIIKDGDTEHNNVAKPIIENAAKEYGKFVSLLTELGASDLPEEAAKIIAKRFQLSEAAAVMSDSRAEFYKTAADLIDTNKRQAPYVRPQIGGGMGSSGGSGGSKAPSSPTEAAELLINKFF